MIQFKKLRLTGFKSFVDHSDLLINTGLTGVVGPNGCGKSNLVEALRWVMGESSAKQMRGAEMEDVIFAGSANRPARNVAEVGITLDNSSHMAPALFNKESELYVSRRIERGRGSNYKVNGRDVRARDVQLLFADAATGARSTAMVSQGKIGALISAKPQARRMILEEAAGITGLHTRRHEAELRLRAAESNLDRLDDVLVTLDAQQKNLEKQARQASRYKTVSDRIRKAEALLFHMRWGNALDELESTRKLFKAADTRVAELTKRAAEAARVQAEAQTKLPDLRKAEGEAQAQVQRLSLERERLDDDEKRLDAMRQDLQGRLDQAGVDLAREREFSKDAEAAQKRLQAEADGLDHGQDAQETEMTEAQGALLTTKADTQALEEQLTALTRQVAEQAAQRNAAKNRIGELLGRIEQLSTKKAGLEAQIVSLKAERLSEEDVRQAKEAQDRLETTSANLDAALEALDKTRSEARASVQGALEDVRAKDAVIAKLEAEEEALVELLDQGGSEAAPVIDQIAVDPGFETALGAALGDDLSAPFGLDDGQGWGGALSNQSPMALPAGLESLKDVSRAPAFLELRLSQIGVVDTKDQAQSLQADLKIGQRLVSREGGMWRWDGFSVLPGAPSAGAVRLKQKNRLAEIRTLWEAARDQAQAAQDQLEKAKQREQDADAQEKELRRQSQETRRALSEARTTLNRLESRLASDAQKIQGAEESLLNLETELLEQNRKLEEARDHVQGLPESETLEGEEQTCRDRLEAMRETLRQRQSHYDALLREAEVRTKRLEEIKRDLENWQNRSKRAGEHCLNLENRQSELGKELETLKNRPAEIEARRADIFKALEETESQRRAASDALAQAEAHMREVDGFARQAETELAKCREERVKFEAHVEQGKQLCMSLAERIRERLDCKPEELAGVGEITEGAELPDLDAAEKRVDRLLRERDNMGPVNLRAEKELEELTEQLETMASEKSDLLKAIEKLRQGIAELNREGRARLLSSFNEVNEHFEDLFRRLFGGGQAHLELIEDDDPLQAGLEIMASPPGKRMQSLSLLSGGEQALTALALLFGVFLTNPAPICVLDEVDAPLDDANVDRFCTLLEEMAKSGKTRFLIITHHRMTMARMHRLFGVTMSERGVSQLVSVDLQRAEELVES